MNRILKKSKNILSLLLIVMLVAAMALSMVSCDKEGTKELPDNQEENSQEKVIALGEGETSFTFKVVFGDKSSKTYTINTNKTTVGDALSELGLISGEEGPYGLMVLTVDGETHNYDVDQSYWAFYVNGEYGMTGVDKTDIVEGTTYSFEAAK